MYRSFKELTVYKKAFALAMEIYRVSKTFPKEKLYSLTGQIRKASRSVCTNLGEGYRKRRYEAHFVSKMSDADMENSETQVWLDFARACEYISQSAHRDLTRRSEEVGRMLNDMIENPEKYARRSRYPGLLTRGRREAAERAVDTRLGTEDPAGPPAGGLRTAEGA